MKNGGKCRRLTKANEGKRRRHYVYAVCAIVVQTKNCWMMSRQSEWNQALEVTNRRSDSGAKAGRWTDCLTVSSTGDGDGEMVRWWWRCWCGMKKGTQSGTEWGWLLAGVDDNCTIHNSEHDTTPVHTDMCVLTIRSAGASRRSPLNSGNCCLSTLRKLLP